MPILMYLNCPFCGSPDIKLSEHTIYGHGDSVTEVFVLCNKCKAHGPDTGYYGSSTAEQKSEAIRKWNDRVPPESKYSIGKVSS